MTAGVRRTARGWQPASEEGQAALRLVLGLTLAVGGMAAIIGAATGQPVVLVAAPTVVLAAAIIGRSVLAAGWAAAAVWLFLVPPARAEALFAPVAMLIVCVAIAIGPERLLDWLGRQVTSKPAEPMAGGWIEEDGRAVD